jgi:hypothetical protein
MRRIKWARHVARMGEMRNACEILAGKPEGRRPLRRPSCRWIIIKQALGNSSTGSGKRPVAASCGHGNELSGFIKFGEFLD